jgi:hypothetical protein
MKRIPIETPFGILKGRDAIHLDHVIFEDRTNKVVLKGAVTRVTRKPLNVDFTGFSLRFHGVLAFRCLELDSSHWDWESCFEEIGDSDWVQTLGGKVTPKHRHFFVQTYDDVFDIVCSGYEFSVQQEGPNQPPEPMSGLAPGHGSS